MRGRNTPGQRINDEDEARPLGVIAHHVAVNQTVIMKRIQAVLSDEPTPGEELVGGNPVPTRYQAHRGARFQGLLDHANLLAGRPAPTPLNRGDDFNAIRRIGHKHDRMPHTY